MQGEVMVSWTLSFGEWLGFSSFNLADPVLGHFCTSVITSQSVLIQI